MSNEDLMIPRYKVIANYPSMKAEGFEIGSIITCRKYDNDFSQNLWCEMNDKYPAIFNPIEWWEDREVKDMPRFIKPKKWGDTTCRVHDYNFDTNRIYVEYPQGICAFTLSSYCSTHIPSSEDEFTGTIAK